MLKRTTIFTAFCISLMLSMAVSESQAQIQEEKIGYVNPTAILQKMPGMSAVQTRLQNFAEDKQKKLAQQNKNLEQEITEYRQKQSVLSEQAKQENEDRIQELQVNLQNAQRKAQEDIQAKQQELVGPLYQEINTGINAVAERMGLSYVLNTRTNGGDVIILYVSDEAQQKYNITEEVMAELGIGT